MIAANSTLTLNDYQSAALTTAIYPGSGANLGLAYCALGLGEAGEVQGKIKKLLRGDKSLDFATAHEIAHELGDLLWYCAALARELNMGLGYIAQLNLDKLSARSARGTIKGDGDNR